MPMRDPPHPGLSVRHDCLEPLNLTVTEAAPTPGIVLQSAYDLAQAMKSADQIEVERIPTPV